MSSLDVDRILQSIKDLPAFPATVQKVSELMSDDEYAMTDLVNAVEYDQAITANVLRMCNSAYFGFPRKISSLRQALSYLGRENIIRIVSTARISKYYRDVEGYRLKAEKLWEHSVGVALMSRILSEKIYGREEPWLFTTGLLHDIGKNVLGEFVNESFQKVMSLVSDEKYSFLEAEQEMLGMNHAEVGGRIASLWRFPKEMIDTIIHHHRPDLMEEGDNTGAYLIYLADKVCMMMGIGGGGADDLAYRGLKGAMEKFKIHHRELEVSMIRLSDEIEKAKELVKLL
ncbi:MAG: HDOD domain-containing protein [Deltaproteobacteria bacterium]|nr:HDOD domain-containing protein [Deltaproteobacteria bacterium]